MSGRIIEKAQTETQRGRLWRAKEILSGAIPNAGYDVLLFEKLGQVLILMNDLPLAGKYLFLSGIRKSEYQEAIDIFQRRYLAKGAQTFIDTLPASVKKMPVSSYPARVQEELQTYGVKISRKEQSLPTQQPENSGRITGIIIGLVGVCALILMILGLIKVSEYLNQMLSQ